MKVEIKNWKVMVDAAVESDSKPGVFYHVIAGNYGMNSCTCSDHVYRNTPCKHITEVLGLLKTPAVV